MKKVNLSQTVKNIIVIAIVAVIFFVVGMFWPSHADNQTITSDLLSQQIQSISELATVEYSYTNMGKFENQATFYGWKVPFTTKSFIVSYDGKIKAGIDMTQADIKVKNNTISIQLPKAKILSHEIDEKSIEVFDETQNIFNQISISDYNQFAIDQKEKMEESVKEKGLLEEAKSKAETTIKTFITTTYKDTDNLKIEFSVTE